MSAPISYSPLGRQAVFMAGVKRDFDKVPANTARAVRLATLTDPGLNDDGFCVCGNPMTYGGAKDFSSCGSCEMEDSR